LMDAGAVVYHFVRQFGKDRVFRGPHLDVR
jgi:hypothetical protein